MTRPSSAPRDDSNKNSGCPNTSDPNFDDTPKSKITLSLILAAIVSSLGGLLFGFDTAVIAGTTSGMSQWLDLSPKALGFAVSSALIGTIIGSVAFTKPGDLLGRRLILRILAFLFFISAIGCMFAWDYWSLVVFRLIGGLGIGGASVFGPMYVSEISPARYRGRLVLLFQYNVCLGILAAYLSNALISTFGFDPVNLQWRIMFGVEGIPALLFIIMLFTIPESPRWLVSKGRIEEAGRILIKVGENRAEEALLLIRESFAQSVTNIKSVPLFQKKYLYPILLGFGVAAFNQLSFVNGFLYYLNDTLREIGASFGGPFQPVLIGAFNVIACTVSIFIIDRFGRKTMLLIGSWGAAVPLGLCAYISWTRHWTELFPWALATFILFFSFSQGAVIWVYISEIFPNTVRAKGQALGSFTHWGLCAAAAQIYPSVAACMKNGIAIPFAFGCVMMIVQFFVVRRFFVETKGVPLEEIEKKLHIK